METFTSLVLKFFILLAFTTSWIAYAADPNPVQDFCVAVDDPYKTFYVNQNLCKNPNYVTADDFYYPEVFKTTDKLPMYGFNVTGVNVTTLPGLNTLGVSVRYYEYEPNAIVPPHVVPRASTIIVVLKGKLLVGFVSSIQNGNRLFTKTLHQGDAFAFPMGLIQFQTNVGRTRAQSLVAVGSQSGGIVSVRSSLFRSTPPIPPFVLERSFNLDANIIRYLQTLSWP